MKLPPKRIAILFFYAAAFLCAVARAQSLDTIGVTLLRAVTTNLNGSGIPVGQAEASQSISDPTQWEINPSAFGVGLPTNLFTYFVSPTPGYTSVNSTNIYPNSLGSESGHAELVAGFFYGVPNGVATNVAHADNYEANTFINYYVAGGHPISERIVNQSFSFGPLATNDQESVDSDYDNYSAQHGTLFVSAANNADNSATVCAPGTSYDCISVGAYLNSVNYSSTGPTPDNGRCKPDITAPADETSTSTPQVAGAAAVLLQAGLRGDGGSTNSAADIRTLKALLLNGAVKPDDWTNSNSSPLDARYGAGVLNIFNSYEQLTGGKHGFNYSTNIPAGTIHPPASVTNSIAALSGWDFNTNTSSTLNDAVNHYFFNLTNATTNAFFTATATLVWNRHQNKTGINNLDLFLYNCASSNLVACSTSLVDNVEHIFIPKLAQGRYDLQVWKAAGTPGVTVVSSSEIYALAWEFFSPTASVAKSGANLSLSWPVYPAGFVVEATTNLISTAWSTNSIPSPVVTNNQNSILLSATNANQFFRLRRP
jgi:Subtilase family